MKDRIREERLEIDEVSKLLVRIANLSRGTNKSNAKEMQGGDTMKKTEDSIQAIKEVEERLYSVLTIKSLALENRLSEEQYKELMSIERYMIKREMDKLKIKVQQLTDTM